MAIVVSIPIVDAATSQSPFITIDPIGNHAIGDVFFINGTTNLPVTENLSIIIQNFRVSSSKNSPDRSYPVIHIDNIPVIPEVIVNSEENGWSANVSESVKQLVSGNYVVYVYASQENNIVTSQIITLLPEKNATLANPQTTSFTTPLPSFTPIQTTSETPTLSLTTPSSPLLTALPIAVIAAMAIARSLRRKK